ncbi:hypothetical protein BVRB_2g033390 [Beta vulgaris subsp. vulgaris]|uniref:Uncharacterized protein n=1 Tax=Beta vulgaris subsp. vulgaris TaxID=3555 RepID=A0A0J8D106_BETVV|nr:hypothetical protein BVRB_2g033390 [Beta vulgaris subsp. vulgaris]
MVVSSRENKLQRFLYSEKLRKNVKLSVTPKILNLPSCDFECLLPTRPFKNYRRPIHIWLEGAIHRLHFLLLKIFKICQLNIMSD